MHLGSIGNIGYSAKNNYKHILLNNFSHESVGGQKTISSNLDFEKIVIGLGYKKYFYINNEKKINKITKKFIRSKGPSLLEVKIKPGSMHDLLRPKNLIKIKKKFMLKKN
jgi:phosphonopyruvate decarboxylase